MPQPRKLRRYSRAAAHGTRRATGSFQGTLAHPADRTEERRGRFDRFAERASFLASSPLFFVVCAALVILWVLALVLGASDRMVAATAGLMSAVTLVLVALLKNAELRAERALQTKLDAIAAALLEDRRGERGAAEEDLERSIGVHEQI